MKENKLVWILVTILVVMSSILCSCVGETNGPPNLPSNSTPTSSGSLNLFSTASTAGAGGKPLEIMQIASGGGNILVIKSDHTLWAWGHNLFGCLGDGTLQDKNVPTQIGSDKDWAHVSSSGLHTVALKTDGTLWAWGDNEYGELGDGSFGYQSNGLTNRRLSPQQIGTAKDWTEVSAGYHCTLAIKKDGSLWTWGSDAYGQLGDGKFVTGPDSTMNDKHVPTLVNAAYNWLLIDAKGTSIFAIRIYGTLWSWGSNTRGELGYVTEKDYNPVPTQIGLDADWTNIFSWGPAAIKKNGSLWLWGENAHGGSSSDSSTWSKMIQVPNSWTSVSIGANNAFLLSSDNKWYGYGNYNMLLRGQVNNPETNIVPPTKPIQINGDWVKFWTNGGSAFGFKNDGTMWAWGNNESGQLGIGFTSAKAVWVPATVQWK